MPTSSREIAENFIVSAVQALTACGQIQRYTINEVNRRVVQTHTDGCVLEVPFEAIQYMNAEQFRKIFATLTRADTARMAGMRTASAPEEPALPEVLPQVVVTDTLARRALTLSTRQGVVRNMVEETYSLAMRLTDKTTRNQRTHKTARGQQFIVGLSKLGIKLPELFAQPVGDVLHAMYGGIEDTAFMYKQRHEELLNEYERVTDRNAQQITEYASTVAAAKADATRLATLRDAAVAWRTSTGSVEEKFENFTAMMSAIDSLTASAPEVADTVELTPLLTPEAAAAQADAIEALNTAAPQNADAEPAGTRR